MTIYRGVSIILVALLNLFSFYQFSYSEELEKTDFYKEICNDISHEYAHCSAYFLITAEAVKRSGKLKTAAKYNEFANTAIEHAFGYAKEAGRSKEMAEKVTNARIKLSMTGMMKEIDNNIENLAILMEKYGFRCKEIMESPEKLWTEMTNKFFERHNIK